ncbi:unannotated protein [freshwater metagenome]|uniref:Unannotated protein n=1 Tax=freshwater metagenome TaxID=449393 RepID=A0A6J5YX89_9ZZZZ|nr:hypothetical protein [Actinomycetota bacterium]
MTEQEQSAEPAGEKIRLPGDSLQPVLVAVGLSLLLIGVLGLWPLSVIGVLIMGAAIYGWVRDAVREHRELPSGNDH